MERRGGVRCLASGLFLFALALLFPDVQARARRRLDGFIEHYETLDYDPKAVESEHHRVRRETPYFGYFNGDPLAMQFRAHGRLFRLQLRPDHQVMKPTTEFVSGGKPFPFDVSELLHGKLADEEMSAVSGAVVNGIFRGVIQSADERYHVEPARRFFSDPQGFHSVIYRASDVSFNHTACGISKKIQDWMAAVQSAAVNSNTKTAAGVGSRYTESANRQRRQANVNLENVECRIRIAADPKFTRQIAIEEGLNPDSDVTNTIAAAMRALGMYVAMVNRIYSTTRFKIASDTAEMIQFAVKNAVVYRTEQEVIDAKFNPDLNQQLIGVDRFLELWSQANHSAFCLAYLFTYRDFDNGVLGLAWVGSDGSASGGVCDKYQDFADGTKKTLNTGIVSLLNFNQRVAAEVSYLTFAHELGHNLGSGHDPDRCTPGDQQGNFIMYAHATSARRPNNDKFSDCSIEAIRKVLLTKAVVNTGGCFDKISDGQLCGNGVREGAEECDCGTDSDCKCCRKNCTLAVGVDCSPQQGPCCNATDCTFFTAAQRPVCSEETECRIGKGTCNGTEAKCQMGPDRENGTLCSGNTSTCYNGACTGSLCNFINQISCFCSGDDSCEVCCQVNHSTTCNPLRKILGNNSAIQDTKLPAGAPCVDYLGFCDFLNFCRRLDDQGPIARLKDTLFSSESIKNAWEWSKKYWYVVLLGVIGLIIVMALVIVYCSKHTEKTVDTMRRKRQGGGGHQGGRGHGKARARRQQRKPQEVRMNNMQ